MKGETIKNNKSGRKLKGPKFLLRPRTFEKNMLTKKECRRGDSFGWSCKGCLFPLHSPGHKPFASSLLTIQGSFPCSNNNITLGLEKQSPAYMKGNRIWACCGYSRMYIQSFNHQGRGSLKSAREKCIKDKYSKDRKAEASITLTTDPFTANSTDIISLAQAADTQPSTADAMQKFTVVVAMSPL